MKKIATSRVTPRKLINNNLKEMIGRVLTSNIFPTFKGRLLYIQDDKCYFMIEENKEFTKYNSCIGMVEYLPESLVVCKEFDIEDREI